MSLGRESFKAAGLFQATNQKANQEVFDRKGRYEEVEGLVLHGASFSPPSGYAAELRHSQSTILLPAEGSTQSSPRGATASEPTNEEEEAGGRKKTEQRLKFFGVSVPQL